MVDSLVKELSLHTDNDEAAVCGMILPPGEAISTLYFGGGTPSILETKELEILIGTVKKNFRLSDDAEITMEANPDDISNKTLKEWKRIGVNRLSVGIQSFVERDLRWMNRAHNSTQAVESLSMIKEAGFNNFSLDLIFGIPHLTDREWMENIDKIISVQAPHIACYALTVEPKTALDKMIRLHKKEDINDADQARQFQILMNKMREAGYEHYEISNFALPGMRSRHNSSYWQQKKYLGIGPSAHSYDGKNRYWNIPNNSLYIKNIVDGTCFFEKEILSQEQRLHEYIMTSLRVTEGMDLAFIEREFGKNHRKNIEKKLDHVNADWYISADDKVWLTDQGKLFADGISVELFDD